MQVLIILAVFFFAASLVAMLNDGPMTLKNLVIVLLAAVGLILGLLAFFGVIVLPQLAR